MIKRRRQSLYFKLFAIYGFTFVAVAAAIAFGFRTQWSKVFHERLRMNLSAYAEYMADDIGSPPDLARAAALNKKTQLEIIIRGGEVKWSTKPELLAELERNEIQFHDQARARWRLLRAPSALKVERGAYEYIFVSPPLREYGRNFYTFTITIVLAGLILLLSYLAIRRVFRPIQWMKEGAQAFGDGDWNKRIPVCRDDDLGELARTMNGMAERIGNQFKSMRELLIAISHELRSPLTRMQVALEFVTDMKIRQSLKEDINLLDRMTETLLEKERLDQKPDSLNLAEEDLADVIRSVAKPYDTNKPDIKLELPSPGAAVARIDRVRLMLAIRNLIENGLKYSGHAGQPLSVSLKVTGNGFEIRIKDHGPGISQEYLSRLGEPFLKIDPSRSGNRRDGGFGLGLSLVYSIVRAHGFDIQAKSESGQGAEFIITGALAVNPRSV